MNKPLLLPLVCVAAVLAGCENEATSYMIDGDKDHSISLVREQRWIWSSSVEQHVVVARYPECQRRYQIGSERTGAGTLEIYQVSPVLYAAREGKTWYALGTEACIVQKFDEAPDEPPGKLVGTFRMQSGGLRFVAAEAGK